MLAKLQGRAGAGAGAAAPQPPTFGCLIVGIGGNNGVTMLAGLRANQLVRMPVCTRGRVCGVHVIQRGAAPWMDHAITILRA